MYKFKSYMMAMLAVGSMAFLSSCGDDEEVKPSPSITLEGANDEDGTVSAGAPISTMVTITSNGGSNIMSYAVTVSYDGAVALPVESESDIDEPNFVTTFSTNARTTAGTEKYTFTATNKDGQTTTKTVTITVTGTAAGMQSYTAKILGNQNADAGSSFSTSTGEVYNLANAKANSSLVDFMYYYSVGGTRAADLASLVAPNHPYAAEIFSSANGVNSWTTKNGTEFKKGLSSSDFTGATTGTEIASTYTSATNTAAGVATQLVIGDVIAFKTAAGKHGLIQVSNITVPNAGNGNKSEMTVNVKIQE